MIRRPTAIGWAALLAAPLMLHPTPAGAHAAGVSRGEYRIDGSRVHAVLTFAQPELIATLPDLDTNRDGRLGAGELVRAHDRVGAWLDDGLILRAGAAACRGRLDDVALLEQDGVALTATYECPPETTAVAVRLALLADLSLDHRHLLTAILPDRTDHAVLFEAQPELVLAAAGPQADARDEPSPFRLGAEHVLRSVACLSFLLLLILRVRSWRSAAGVIAAFTLAHSVTLAAAATWNCAPPPALVATAIAVSIVYLGAENCFSFNLRRRRWLAFAFGLLHGFDLAGALQRIAPAPVQPIGLMSFHAGVEIAQFAVLGLELTLLSWLGARLRFVRSGSLRLAGARS